MASINSIKLPPAVYVRLPLEITEQIRQQAIRQERTQSSQIRFLLQKALQLEEQEEKKDTNE